MILHVVAMNHFASGCRFSTWIIVACCYSILTESCHLNINMHHPCLSVGWNFDMLKFSTATNHSLSPPVTTLWLHPISDVTLPCGFVQCLFFKICREMVRQNATLRRWFSFSNGGIGNRSLEGTSPSLRWCFSPYLKPRQIWISFFFGENWRDLTPSEKCMRRTHFTMVDIVFFKRKSQSSERVMPTLRIILPLPL